MEFPYQSEDDPPDERHFYKTGVVCLGCILLLILAGLRMTAFRGHQKAEETEPIAAEQSPAVETHLPTSNLVRENVAPKTVAKSSRPKRRSRPSYRAPIQQARFESLTQDVLISNGRVKQSAPAYYGSVDVSQAHNIMQNSILRGAANQELPITPENSGEKAA